MSVLNSRFGRLNSGHPRLQRLALRRQRDAAVDAFQLLAPRPAIRRRRARASSRRPSSSFLADDLVRPRRRRRGRSPTPPGSPGASAAAAPGTSSRSCVSRLAIVRRRLRTRSASFQRQPRARRPAPSEGRRATTSKSTRSMRDSTRMPPSQVARSSCFRRPATAPHSGRPVRTARACAPPRQAIAARHACVIRPAARSPSSAPWLRISSAGR